MRKGQAALEFLMTYGWAILVVLAAIAALAYFGVLSPDRFLPGKCTVTGGFSCSEYKINDATDEIQVNVQNNLGSDADSVIVYLSSADCAIQETNGLFAAPLENGKKTGLLNFTCDTFPASKFKGDLEVVYVKSGDAVNHTASGSVSGQVE